MRTFGGRRPTGTGLQNYTDKPAANRALRGKPAQNLTIANVLWSWTGNQLQALAPGALEPVPPAPPAAPSLSVAAVGAALRITLSAGSGLTSRAIFRNSVLLATLGGAVNSYDDSTVVAGTAYLYTGQDTNVSDAGPLSAAVSGTLPVGGSVPAAPTLSVAVVGSALRVTLSAAAGLTSRALYRDGTLLTTLGGAVNSYDDATAAAGTTYSYTAADTNTAGTGVLSAAVPGSVPVPIPAAPTLNVAAVGAVLRVTLNAVSGLTSRAIYRGGTLLTTLAGGATSYDDTTVVANGAYQYTAVDTNTSGAGPASAAVTGTMPPAAPVISSVTPGNNQLTVAYAAAPAGVTAVNATRLPAFSTPPTLALNSTGFVDATAANGTSYAYTVYFTNAGGTTASAAVSATPVATTGTLSSVATRATPMLTVSSGSVQQDTSRMRVHATSDIVSGQVEFANWYATVGDQDGPNAIRVQAAWEIWGQTSTPTFIPITFSGAASATLAPGVTVRPDAIGTNIPDSSLMYVRTHVSVATLGQKWPTGPTGYGSRDEGTFAAVQTLTVDAAGAAAGAVSIPVSPVTTAAIAAGTPLLFGAVQVVTSSAVAAGVNAVPVNATSGAIAAGATASHFDPSAPTAVTRYVPGGGVAMFAPLRIVGQGTLTPAVHELGTSITAGQNDGAGLTATSTNVLPVEFGFARRIYRFRNVQLNMAKSGERVQDNNTTTKFRYRLALINSGDTVLCDYGTNDITNGRTATQLIADVTAFAAMIRSKGAKYYHSTMLPRTTAADGLTPLPGFEAGPNSERGKFNTWLKSTAVSSNIIDGYIDTAAWVETAPESGQWITGTTTDGTHPARLGGHETIAENLTSAERTLIGAPASPFGIVKSGLVGKFLLDGSGSTLTDTGIYGAYNGSLGTATRRSGGGLTLTTGQSATLGAALSGNLDTRTGLGAMIAFKVPATLPSADMVLLSMTGLSITLRGTGGGAAAGQVQLTLTAGGSAFSTTTAAALMAGDHAYAFSYDGANIFWDVDGVPLSNASKTGAAGISGTPTLAGVTDIHAVLIYGDNQLQPSRAATYRGLKTILNARAGVALP